MKLTISVYKHQHIAGSVGYVHDCSCVRTQLHFKSYINLVLRGMEKRLRYI